MLSIAEDLSSKSSADYNKQDTNSPILLLVQEPCEVCILESAGAHLEHSQGRYSMLRIENLFTCQCTKHEPSYFFKWGLRSRISAGSSSIVTCSFFAGS